MSTAGLPTIWELVAEAARTLPEPFSRAALINWVSARRPDVGVSSIASHVQFATVNAGSGHHPFAGREPLLERVDRGRYQRYRGSAAAVPTAAAVPGRRVVLVASSGETAGTPQPVARLYRSAGFERAREFAASSGDPWFVLSAKHGLLDPDDVVGPYELLMDERSGGYRAAWGEWVCAQLADRVQLAGVTVEVHGGVDFAQPLRQPLQRRGAVLDIPLPGTWREFVHDGPDEGAGPGGGAGRDEGAGADTHAAEPPVRAALGRLLDLVVRHRPPGSAAS